MNPMNPALFAALQRRFGDVHITKPGERRQVRYFPDPLRPGKTATTTLEFGEQYVCNCPFCGDQRKRLNVSYEYGQVAHQLKQRNNHLFKCFNEDCQMDPTNRNLFRNMVAIPIGSRLPSISVPTDRHVAPLPAAPPPQFEVALPANLVGLESLGDSHPAIQYLRSRQFDPQEIATQWGVTFCDWSVATNPQFKYRLVIPIYRPGPTLGALPSGEQRRPFRVGWQAREIGMGDAGEPKYLTMTGMQKSQLLYGLPEALNTSGPVWIVEGVTDAWRVGPGAVALFGKSLGRVQHTLLLKHFVGRPLVVLLDRDARKDALGIQRILQDARRSLPGDRRVVIAEIPAGRSDPGDSTREELLASTEAALSQSTPQGMSSERTHQHVSANS